MKRRFLFDLRPLGISFRGETVAKTACKAVFNGLFRALGSSERVMRAYLNFVEREGESGWDDLVKQMAVEVIDAPMAPRPPEPVAPVQPPDQQLEFQAFQKRSDQQHPAAAIAQAWRDSHRMKFLPIDRLGRAFEQVPEGVISVKMDGENVAIDFDASRTPKVEVVTSKGTIRSALPATEEAAKALTTQGIKKAVFMGELYAIDERGLPQSYMKAASILKDPAKGQDQLIQLAVFDVIKVDGKDWSEEDPWKRIEYIREVFGKHPLVHPVHAVKGGVVEAREIWEEIEEKGWEGIVIQTGTSLFKIKPLKSFDLVVLAIEKSPKFIDRIGAVLAAFIDTEGRFRLTGGIGGGFSEVDRGALYQWAQRNKVSEDEERIWVDPYREPLIIEVVMTEVNVKRMPSLRFKDHKWVTVEDAMSGTFRFPRYVRTRDDKKPVERDVSPEQIGVEAFRKIMAGMEKGRWIKTATGAIGKILGFVEDHGYPGWALMVEWHPPLFGSINVLGTDPTEVVEVAERREALSLSSVMMAS